VNFLKNLTGLFSPSTPTDNAYWLAVKCTRCDEQLEARVNLSNDLSLADDGSYFCRKVLVGSRGCYQSIEVELTFNTQRQLLNRHITGGQFVEG
jgi:hypothetical protein